MTSLNEQQINQKKLPWKRMMIAGIGLTYGVTYFAISSLAQLILLTSAILMYKLYKDYNKPPTSWSKDEQDNPDLDINPDDNNPNTNELIKTRIFEDNPILKTLPASGLYPLLDTTNYPDTSPPVYVAPVNAKQGKNSVGVNIAPSVHSDYSDYTGRG